MRTNPDVKIVRVMDEILAVPTGNASERLKGVVSLSEEAAFVFQHINGETQKSDLLRLVLDEYDVSEDKASSDLNRTLTSFRELGLID